MHIVNITLFMAQPIDFPRLEANRPNQWDNSSQGQANHPSGRANRPSSVASPVLPVSSVPSMMHPFFFILKFSFELNLTVVCQNHPCFLFILLSIPICAVSFGLFLVYDTVLSIFLVYLCGVAPFLSQCDCIYLLYILLP